MSKPLQAMTDAELQSWCTQALAKIAPAYAAWGLSQATADEFGEKAGAYSAALSSATDPQTRGKSTVFAKKTARDNLVDFLTKMIKQIQGSLLVTDQMRVDLGINVRKSPERIPAPDEGPVIDLVSMTGHEMKIRLHSTDDLNARPWNAKGANVFTLVASEPTDDPSAWEFYCTTADRHVTIDFPQTLPVGTQVYVTAFWYSPRGESSPAAAAVGSRINYSVELAPSLKLKQAA